MEYKNAYKIALIAGASVTLVLGVLALLKWFFFRYTMMDLAIIHQIFWNTLHGEILWSSIQQGMYFGEHFKPIIFFLLPLYALLGAHPLSLVTLQLLAALSAALPLMFLAKSKGLSALRALTAALLFLGNPILWNVLLNEYHVATLLLPALIWTYYFYSQKQYRAFLLTAACALLIREDAPLVIGMFGVLAALERRSSRWIWPPLLGAGVYFVTAMTVIGHFSPTGGYKYLAYFAPLGNSIYEITYNSLRHPLLALHLIFTGNYLQALTALAATSLFLPLIAGPVVVLAGLFLPLAGIALQATGTKALFLLYSHYATVFLAIGAIATVEAQAKRSWIRRVPDGLCLAIVCVTIIYLQYMWGPLPTAARLARSAHTITEPTLHSALSRIPEQAVVLSGMDALAPLSRRTRLYFQHYAYTGATQFFIEPYVLPEHIDYVILSLGDLLPYRFSKGGRGSSLKRSGPENLGAVITSNNLTPEYFSDTHIIFSANGTLPAPITFQKNTPGDITRVTPDLRNPFSIIGYRAEESGLRVYIWKSALSTEYPVALRVNETWIPLGYGIWAPESWATATVVGQYVPMQGGTLALAEVTAHQQLDGLASAFPVVTPVNVFQEITVP